MKNNLEQKIKKKQINEINEIKNDIIKLEKLIDIKLLNITDENIHNEKLLETYKLKLENIILEHHKVCKELFRKDL